MKVTTKSGFKCEINEHILNDWRLARAIAKTHSDDDDEKMSATVDMVSLIMGEYEKPFYEHLMSKNEHGIVSEDAVVADIVSIIGKLKTLKN